MHIIQNYIDTEGYKLKDKSVFYPCFLALLSTPTPTRASP